MTNKYSPGGSEILKHSADSYREGPVPQNSNLDVITAHVERHLGPVAWVFHEIVSSNVHVDILLVTPSERLPFYTLVTCGMSDRKMNAPVGAPSTGFAELCISLPANWNLREADFADENNYWPIRWLKILARLPHDFGTWLGWGHSVPNGDPATRVAQNAPYTGFALLDAVQLPPEFSVLERPHDAIHIYNLVPLFDEEMTLKLEQGSDALIERFKVFGVTGVVDLGRPNTASKNVDVRIQNGHVSVYGHVSNDPMVGAMSQKEAASLQSLVTHSIYAGADQDTLVNLGGKLLMSQKYIEAIEVFTELGERFEGRRGDAANNIGAAYFFLRQYDEAIVWYQRSLAYGFDAGMVRDNILEAEQAKRSSPAQIRPTSTPATSMPAPTRSASGNSDYSAAVRNIVAPHVGRKVLLEIPPKKRAAVGAILRELTGSSVIAVFDLTMFASCSDAVVVTGSHLIAKEFEERVVVPLADIVGSQGFASDLEDRLSVVMRGGLTLSFPCGGHGEVLSSVVHAIASMNQR